MNNKVNKIRTQALLGTALVGAMAFSSVAFAAPRNRSDVRDERRDVKEARKEVKQEKKDLRKADSRGERREARKDLRDARQDLRREKHDVKREKRNDDRRDNRWDKRPNYNNRPNYNYRPNYNSRPNYNNRPNYNYRPGFNIPLPPYGVPYYNSGNPYDYRYDNRYDNHYDYRSNDYRTYTGVVTDIDSDGDFEMRVGGTTYHVYDADLPRGFNEGDIVRVYGERFEGNKLRNARVEIVNNR